MSIKRLLLASAALMCAVGLEVAPAIAATPQCGQKCGSIFSRELGEYGNYGPIETVLDGQATIGQPVILKAASNTDPAQDIIPRVSSVKQAHDKGLVSAEVAAHYGELPAVQQEFAPFGIESHMCVGLDKPPHQNQGLALQTCNSERSVWILDFPNAPSADFFPIVNASNRDFEHPYAMDLRRNQIVNGRNTPQIVVRRLKFLGGEKRLPDTQLWGFVQGPLP